jgi:hypothetical protein
MAEQEDNELQERMDLIQEVLDYIRPIPDGISNEERDYLDKSRKMVFLGSGWDKLPTAQLRMLLEKSRGMV